MRLSQWERCPFPAATKHWGLTQQQQLLALQPAHTWHPTDLLSLPEVVLYLREFSFTFPARAADRQKAAGYMRLCTYEHLCMCIAIGPSSWGSFSWDTLSCVWACWPWAAVHDSCCPFPWELLGVEDFWEAEQRQDLPCSVLYSTHTQHDSWWVIILRELPASQWSQVSLPSGIKLLHP